MIKMAFWGIILLLFALLSNFNSYSSVIASKPAIVKTLPGFPGDLPFLLQTGYISVNDSELFYYFIESQGDPKQDPLFIWLSGGPGCSSLAGLLYELGPLEFDANNYIGGLPKLAYYPHAWTKTASFIFLDSPVGAGFSYSTTTQGWAASDSTTAEQVYQFLRKWLEENPSYLLNQLFIGGDSYAGIIVPLVTKLVVQGNDDGLLPRLNLKGYVVGSPITDEFTNSNSKIQFAHRMALISDELYEKLKSKCNGNYVVVHPSNAACLTTIEVYKECVRDIWTFQILEPLCEFDPPLHYMQDLVLSSPKIRELWCPYFQQAIAFIWGNDASVQEALHVRKGMIKEWNLCNQSFSYTYDVESVVHVHQWLSKRNLTLLVSDGDRDMVVPFVATDIWLRALNLTIVKKWRPWFVDEQVAGYTRKYSENEFHLTYAIVKGCGHPAPQFKRRECYEMFQRWLNGYPL